jgi:hypothetical protein
MYRANDGHAAAADFARPKVTGYKPAGKHSVPNLVVKLGKRTQFQTASDSFADPDGDAVPPVISRLGGQPPHNTFVVFDTPRYLLA